MTTYRGQDGSVSLSTNVVGETTQWSVNLTMEVLQDTAQGDVAQTYKPGLADGTGTFTAHFDYGDTNGQTALLNEIAAVAPDGAIADLRFRLSATKYLSGAAVITSFAIGAALGNIVEATCNFQCSDVWAVTWS